MNLDFHPWHWGMALALAAAPLAQAPMHSVATAAIADASSTEAGGFLLAIPGVDSDFVLFADGQFVVRSNGTARFSSYLQRPTVLDREFFLELEFSGRLQPTSPGYPPAGSPVTTLLSSAYVPLGPVNPGTYVYYTVVNGTLTGLRSFQGARLTATNHGAAQIGDGASNKNVNHGFALDLDLTVVQQPVFGAIVPTGRAQLRGDLAPNLTQCATHVDADPAVSTGPARAALNLPGVAADYIFMPSAQWLERADGTALLQGSVRRQSNYSDEWYCVLTFGGRIDPGSAAHPPANRPVLNLLPTAYASQGGAIDPNAWRYYATATGTLQGAGMRAGGQINLTQSGAFQVGLGSDQGNRFFGMWGLLVPTIAQQPTASTIVLTGNLTLQANVATHCILPPPQVVTGISQAIASVTQQKLVYTGLDLGWVEQVAIGPTIVATKDPRRWYEGHLRVVDHTTVELSIPQGLAIAQYPARLLNATRLSNALTIDVQAPTAPVLRTENDRLAGEQQHWVVHKGGAAGFAYSLICLSDSNLPSFAPGVAQFAIGNQFSSFAVVGGALHDPVTGTAVLTYPSIPTWIAGHNLYAQAAILDLSLFPALFPATTSDTWLTAY
ncbi:MAG: hypothetical protein ABIP94_13140 [Planctomycetota bacterium]